MADDNTDNAGGGDRNVLGLAACEGKASAADSNGARAVSAVAMATGSTRLKR